MSTNTITKTATFAGSFDDAVGATKEALAQQGFGVLSEINLQAVLKKKLGVDYPPTLILGACNPQLAHRALTAEPDVAALIPCNVVVREIDNVIEIAAVNPAILNTLLDHPQIKEVAKEGEERLDKVLTMLTTST